MNIGNKIRKIRELKNITPKDMADRLNITPQGYSRIERDEVAVNVERLLEIAGIFEMKPEEVLCFDEKMVFNNHGEIKGGAQNNNGTINNFPDELKKLYEDKFKLQEEMILMLKKRVKELEGR